MNLQRSASPAEVALLIHLLLMLAPVIAVMSGWQATEHAAKLASAVWKVKRVAPLG